MDVQIVREINLVRLVPVQLVDAESNVELSLIALECHIFDGSVLDRGLECRIGQLDHCLNSIDTVCDRHDCDAQREQGTAKRRLSL